MGMSASQARLLSITARLTNNEFRSQTITNSKLRLATESEEASQAYMDALNQKQLQFMYYDNNGNAQKVPLTGAFLSTYAPMKNQYSVLNAAGKILVSHTDAVNFEETNDLADFLDRYGLLIEKPDLGAYNAALNTYNSKYAAYLVELENYKIRKAAYDIEYNDYLIEYRAYLEKMEWYELNQSQTDLSAVFFAAMAAHPYCYDHALDGNISCYKHVLNHLIDYVDSSAWPRTWDPSGYRTSANDTFVPDDRNYGNLGRAPELIEVSVALNDKYNGAYTRLCDGDDDLSEDGEQNRLEAKLLAGQTPSKFDILVSDYTYTRNSAGEYVYSLKSLKQKAIDMYYLIQFKSEFPELNGSDVVDVLKGMLVNFTEGDMKKVDMEKPELTAEPPTPVKAPIAPVPPTPPDMELKVKDLEETQWYVNLWYKMNGSDTANLVRNKQVVIDEETGEIGTAYVVEGCGKAFGKSNYEEFEGNLFTNSEWLEFALEHGLVSMEQARYYNPSADSGKVMEITSEGITWQSIIHTEAADIISVDDEKAIAIAEAKYKRRVTEIQNKDKKYDQDLKKLDTEHNALQTEYESIKEVISKNTERSFKAFS